MPMSDPPPLLIAPGPICADGWRFWTPNSHISQLAHLGQALWVRGGDIARLGGVGGEVVELPRRIGVLGEAALDGFPIAHQDGPLAAVAGEIPCDGRARRLSYAAQGGREGFALAGELRYST